MTERDRPDTELSEERLGSALRSLAAELVAERRKAARLHREVAELETRLNSFRDSQPEDGSR